LTLKQQIMLNGGNQITGAREPENNSLKTDGSTF